METHQDWTPDQIIKALRQKGLTLTRLAIENDVPLQNLSNVLLTPWYRAEQLIAASLGITAEEIWHSRYFDKNGKRRLYTDMKGKLRLRATEKNLRSGGV